MTYILLYTVAASVKAISSLENAVMRNKWEDMFNARYIQGILENVNKEIRTAMDSILEDNEQGCTAVL